jgi:hypothetical protein
MIVRPDAPEILQGIAVNLERDVMPALSDPQLVGEVAVMAYLLRGVADRWDGEDAQLRSTIARWEELLARAADPLAATAPGLAARASETATARVDSDERAALVERRNVLAAVMADVLVACERADHGDGALAELRADAYAAVAAR